MATRVAHLALAVVLGMSSGRGQAQTARATTADFRWMVGTWTGRLATGSGVITVAFAAPDAGLMTGVMHLADRDTIRVVELISLVDTPFGPELRFRHFSSTLEAYEPTFKQVMRLRSHTADHDVFENQVAFDKALMSTYPRTTTFIRRGRDEFVGRSDVLDDARKPGIIEVTYRRVP